MKRTDNENRQIYQSEGHQILVSNCKEMYDSLKGKLLIRSLELNPLKEEWCPRDVRFPPVSLGILDLQPFRFLAFKSLLIVF